jgi:hypothetical protein
MELEEMYKRIDSEILAIERHKKELIDLLEDAIDELEDLIPSDRLDDQDNFIEREDLEDDEDGEDLDEDDSEFDEDDGTTFNELKECKTFAEETDFETYRLFF